MFYQKNEKGIKIPLPRYKEYRGSGCYINEKGWGVRCVKPLNSAAESEAILNHAALKILNRSPDIIYDYINKRFAMFLP